MKQFFENIWGWITSHKLIAIICAISIIIVAVGGIMIGTMGGRDGDDDGKSASGAAVTTTTTTSKAITTTTTAVKGTTTTAKGGTTTAKKSTTTTTVPSTTTTVKVTATTTVTTTTVTEIITEAPTDAPTTVATAAPTTQATVAPTTKAPTTTPTTKATTKATTAATTAQQYPKMTVENVEAYALEYLASLGFDNDLHRDLTNSGYYTPLYWYDHNVLNDYEKQGIRNQIDIIVKNYGLVPGIDSIRILVMPLEDDPITTYSEVGIMYVLH